MMSWVMTPRHLWDSQCLYQLFVPRRCPLEFNAHVQVEKAPLESYADVGGLEQQVQEIKEAVELPLTHPELYEDIGIKPPKVPAVTPLHGLFLTAQC